jgi:hypothetical protein
MNFHSPKRDGIEIPDLSVPILKAVLSAAALLVLAGFVVAYPRERGSAADFISAICTTSFRSSSHEEAQFLSENISTMNKMMIDMGIQPLGDIDADFAALMTPHHQGAIAMAQTELRYGRNEQLRRMAQEIIVTQQQEISAIRLALGQPPLLSTSEAGLAGALK